MALHLMRNTCCFEKGYHSKASLFLNSKLGRATFIDSCIKWLEKKSPGHLRDQAILETLRLVT